MTPRGETRFEVAGTKQVGDRHANARTLLCTGLACLTLVLAAGTCAEAAAWCANYTDNAGTNCGFYTIQQCQAAVSGVGGYCAPNPAVPEQLPAGTRRRTR